MYVFNLELCPQRSERSLVNGSFIGILLMAARACIDATCSIDVAGFRASVNQDIRMLLSNS